MSSPLPPLSAFLARIDQSLKDASFVECRIQPASGFPVTVRQVNLREGMALSFVTHETTRDLTQNLPPAEGQQELARRLAGGGTAWLRTTGKGWQLVATPGQRARLVAHSAQPVATPSREHNREKKHHLRDASAWLNALDLTDAKGRPLPGRSDKIHQIERYADLLGHLVREAGWQEGQPLSVADLGCGKGYLTFAVWHLLRRQMKLDASVTGLDANPAVVATAQGVVTKLGAEKLSFKTGSIADAALPPCDLFIALHACNDATDHALARGVAAAARIIVVAPCCHKDARRALTPPDPLTPLLVHGLFKERFAEWLTDGLRALALEAAGYRVTVSEFVDAGHTPKNVLIGAVRGSTPDRQQRAQQQYAALKNWAGLGAMPTDAVFATAH